MDATAEINRIGATASAVARQQPPPLIELKGGNLFLREPTITPEVAPGGEVSIDATVSNRALFISVGDPDACENEANDCTRGIFDLSSGYCYELRVSPQWRGTEGTGPQCVNLTELGTGDKNHSFRIPAPQQTGEFSIQLTLEAPGSRETGTAVRNVTVTTTPSPPPDGDDGGIFEQISDIIVLLILLAAIVQFGGLVDRD